MPNNPLSLLTMLGLLGENPSSEPQNPMRQPVSNPESGMSPAAQGPQMAALNDPAVGWMMGRAMGGDQSFNGVLNPLIRMREQQMLQQQQARQFASAIAPVNGLVREQRYTEAANAYRTAAGFAPTPAHAAALEKTAQKYEEMGAQVDIARMVPLAVRVFKEAEAQQSGSGPQAIMGNPQLVAGLARRPGGVEGLLKELAPARNITESQITTTPSYLIGGEPSRQVLPKPPTIDTGTQTKLNAIGVNSEVVRQAYESGNPQFRQFVDSAIEHASQQTRAEGVVDRLKMDKDMIGAIGVLGYKPYEVLTAFEGGDPAAQRVVAQAQKTVDKRAVDKAVSEATQKLLVERSVKGGDPFSVPGKEAYDINTGQPVHVTLGMSQNPKTFAANGGNVTYMTTQEAQQMRFMLSEIDPSLAAAKQLSSRILAKAKVANIPQGAALDTQKWAGDADVAQFKEEIRKLIVAEGRIEGGSVRIPVTMMHMLEGTLPTTFSTVDQASRLLNSLQAAAINRRKGFLGREDFTPIPTEQGDFVTAKVMQKDGRWNLDFKATPETVTTKSGKKLVVPK